MTKWEYEATSYEDFIQELARMAKFWADQAAKMPAIQDPIRDIPNKILGDIGYIHTFMEETYIKNRIELSEAAKKLDDAEKFLRQQIDRDVSRVRVFIDAILPRGGR
ncbi:hypothetical protein LCGC14_2223770 [marine sediment metagenome]|uniref:Uncharacterized protein n=1 Tax=marine sediment metagenome TaxID=412755 RepID=A0A0F9DA98_9ZZZZ